MNLELKKVEFSERMSEETNCYCADLWVDGKKCAFVNNEGKGGDTYYRAHSAEMFELLKQAEAYALKQPEIVCKELDFSYDSDLGVIIDKLFEQWVEAKDQKKLDKMCKKGLAFGTPASYSYISWASANSLKEISLEVLQKTYDEYKGKGCLNSPEQLTELGIKL